MEEGGYRNLHGSTLGRQGTGGAIRIRNAKGGM